LGARTECTIFVKESQTVKAIIQSVFKPHHLSQNKEGLKFITHLGWIFIVARWFYYSILFQFRDYHGAWTPFAPPPFHLDLDSYANLQRAFSLPFGIILMLLMAFALRSYLAFRDKKASPFVLLNILGVAFFLPFVFVQPIDQLIIATIGWKLLPITILHTAILLWESWAAVEIIATIMELKVFEKLVGIFVLSATWIVITGILWR
jgi:hypothetical protein